MLTLVGSLTGLVLALLLLGALVYAIVRYSPDERNIWYFMGIMMLFGAGLGFAALMSLISQMAHDLVVMGIFLALAAIWALSYAAGFGKKTLVLGLIAIIIIYGYGGYSAFLYATGGSPLARGPQTTNSSAPQDFAEPFFQGNGDSTSSPGLERKEPEEPLPASPKPTPQVVQSPPTPAQMETKTAPSPKPSTGPRRSARRPQRRAAETPRPSPEPPAMQVETPPQEPRRTVAPPAVSRRQEEPTASPSTGTNSAVPPAPAVQQSPPTSPTASSVPEGCYGMTEEGSLNCLLDSQQ